MKICLLFTALLFAASPAMAQSVGGTPFLAVHGSAKIEIIPDIFPVQVEVADTGMDLSKSQALVEQLTRGILAQARKLGLEEASIQVGDFRISPQEDYDQTTQKQVFRGNRYERNLRFKFHSLADVKAFVAAAPSGKQVQVSTAGFESSSEHEVRRKLLVDAISDARKTADVLAAGIGRRVTVAQTISTTPMVLSAGSYINAIDVRSVESTTILTAEQIARIPVGRDITSVALLAPGAVRSEIALEKGAIALQSDVYILYLLGD
ncbi:hypothetical protein BH11PSE14_BH11PSE14_19520 [soil metagenome]